VHRGNWTLVDERFESGADRPVSLQQCSVPGHDWRLRSGVSELADVHGAAQCVRTGQRVDAVPFRLWPNALLGRRRAGPTSAADGSPGSPRAGHVAADAHRSGRRRPRAARAARLILTKATAGQAGEFSWLNSQALANVQSRFRVATEMSRASAVSR